jgi:CRP-like cAMP-binding protein
MVTKLIDYFASISPLSKDERNAIAQSALIKKYKQGTILLKEGQVSTETYFVLEGCIQQYTMVDGEEKTTDFFTENQWVLSLSGFDADSPSAHFLVCVEETTDGKGFCRAAEHCMKQ